MLKITKRKDSNKNEEKKEWKSFMLQLQAQGWGEYLSQHMYVYLVC